MFENKKKVVFKWHDTDVIVFPDVSAWFAQDENVEAYVAATLEQEREQHVAVYHISQASQWSTRLFDLNFWIVKRI